MSTNDIDIRPASRHDGKEAAGLIRMAGPELFAMMTGTTSPEESEKALSRLWEREDCRFGWIHGRVAEAGGRILGMCTSLDGSMLPRLNRRMAGHLLAVRGPGILAKVILHPLRYLALLTMPEARADEWYVCTLATLLEARGKGVASALLADAEQRAREAGKPKLSLIVEEGNVGARRLYEKFGLEVEQSFRTAGHRAFTMVKNLLQ